MSLFVSIFITLAALVAIGAILVNIFLVIRGVSHFGKSQQKSSHESAYDSTDQPMQRASQRRKAQPMIQPKSSAPVSYGSDQDLDRLAAYFGDQS